MADAIDDRHSGWLRGRGRGHVRGPATAQATAQATLPPPTDSASFAEYTAGGCAMAVDRLQRWSARAWVDTMPVGYTRPDTLNTIAVQGARACTAHLSIDALTDPRDLLYLAQAYLAMGADDLADRAIKRRLALDAGQPIAVRGATLNDIANLYLTAKPTRGREFREYWNRLLQLGPAVAQLQIGTAWSAQIYYHMTGNDTLSLQFARELLAVIKPLSPAIKEREQIYIRGAAGTAYQALVAAAEGAGGGDSAKKVVARLRDEARAMGIGEIVAQSMQQLDADYKLYGAHAPPLQGTLWYGTSETQRPARGKVSIVVFTMLRDAAPRLRRLKAKYGEQLDITIVKGATGHYNNAGPISAKEEGDSVANYYRTVLDVPAAVLMNESPMIRRADGRVIRRNTLNEAAYGGAGLYIVDQQQRIQFVYRLPGSGVDEQRIMQVVDKLLGATEPARATSSN